MDENVIITKNLLPRALGGTITPVDLTEVKRYAGLGRGALPENGEFSVLLDEVISELTPLLSYRVCYRKVELQKKDNSLVLPFKSNSLDLKRCLGGSKEIVMFAATIGLELDRRLARYNRLSPTKALLIQAFGSERVEAVCDAFCESIRLEAEERNLMTTPRFSPGYGDFGLETQIELFKLLDCNRKIGISLNESLIMSPSKSVTAVFGLYEACEGINKNAITGCSACEGINKNATIGCSACEGKIKNAITGCSACGLDCAYRKGSEE